MLGLVAASTDTSQDRKRDGDEGCPSHYFEEIDWERRSEWVKKGSVPSPLPFCTTAALPSLSPPPPSLPLSMILFLSLSPYSSLSVAGLRGRAPAAPWWFSLSATRRSTGKAACPSCHCSARPSCSLHYSYCSCSWPITSTLPLLSKCPGEWMLLFYHCSLLYHSDHSINLNLWLFCFCLQYIWQFD